MLGRGRFSQNVTKHMCTRRHIKIYPSPHYKKRLSIATPVQPLVGSTHGVQEKGSLGAGSMFQNGLSSAGWLLPDFKLRKPLPSVTKHGAQVEALSPRYTGTSAGHDLSNDLCSTSADWVEPQGVPLTAKEVNALKKTFHHRIWKALYLKRWDLWEQLFSKFRQFGLPYDEVSYTLKLHGYVLSHRHKSENAYLVISEMKQAKMHPAIIRLNEEMLHSYFELHEIFCGPMRTGWQVLCRLAWHTAVRLRRRRQKRLRAHLYQLPPNEVLSMSNESMDRLMERQFVEALVPPAEAIPKSSSTLVEFRSAEGEEDAEMLETDDEADDDTSSASEEEDLCVPDLERLCESFGVPIAELCADDEDGAGVATMSDLMGGNEIGLSTSARNVDVIATKAIANDLKSVESDMKEVFGDEAVDCASCAPVDNTFKPL